MTLLPGKWINTATPTVQQREMTSLSVIASGDALSDNFGFNTAVMDTITADSNALFIETDASICGQLEDDSFHSESPVGVMNVSDIEIPVLVRISDSESDTDESSSGDSSLERLPPPTIPRHIPTPTCKSQ